MCVKPFDTTQGYPECGNGGWSRVGCVYYDIVSSSECSTAGGEWKQRAFDESSCSAHGAGCNERNFWQLTPKDNTLCASSGGTSQPYYKWHGGSWITGEMIPLQWKAREFTSINRWQATLNWTKLHTEVEEVANLIISKAIKSSLMCQFNLKSDALAKVACDCGSNARTDCFTADSLEEVPIGEQTFFSGIGGTAEWSTVTVTVDPNGVPADQDDALVEATTSGSIDVLLSSTSSFVARKRSPYNPNEYEVVTNHVNYVVGQLLSDGVTLTIPENVTVNICININENIPRDPESLYPIKDFAGYNGTKWWPLNLEITTVGDYVQFCADISSSGTYFAILRLDEWEYATGVPPTAIPPTNAPTPAPPTAAPPTEAPTTSPPTTTVAPPTFAPIESNLSGGVIVAIVLGSLAGVTLIVVIIIVCTRSVEPLSEYSDSSFVDSPMYFNQTHTRSNVRNKTRHGFKKQE